MILAIVQDISFKSPTQVLFELSQVITAFTIIMSFLITIVQSFTKLNPLNGIRSWLNEPVMEEVNKLKYELTEVVIAKMKTDIFNERLPLSERVKVARTYLDMGLNGDVSIQAKVLENLYEDELRGKLCNTQRR